MLTTDAINDFKDFIDNIIAYAKVTVNGVSEKRVTAGLLYMYRLPRR